MGIFQKDKYQSEEWKRTRREKLLKIKYRIERILDKEYSLTSKEKGWRDRLFHPLASLCRTISIRANHITIFGVVLVLAMTYFFMHNRDLVALALAIGAALTDAVDGPVARFKNIYGVDDITAFGTFLDHFRDYCLAASFGYFSFFYHNRFGGIEIVLAALIILLYIGIFIGTVIKLRKYKLPDHSLENKFSGYLLPEMQTSFWGRAQFFLLIVGTIVMFLGRFNAEPALIQLSYVILGIHLGINFQNLVEEYILS